MQRPPSIPIGNTKELAAIKGIIGTLYSAQKALRALAPEYKWTGIGNLLGDFGEYIAVNHYGLIKSPGGSNGYDAKTEDGKTVQVKTNHSSPQIGFRGKADLMLVIHVFETGDWEEIYFGDFERVFKASRYSSRDNKYMIPISKLRTLQLKNQQFK